MQASQYFSAPDWEAPAAVVMQCVRAWCSSGCMPGVCSSKWRDKASSATYNEQV